MTATEARLASSEPARGSFHDLSEAEYHADPCPEPSLSSSAALTLLTRSPLHAWHEHPRLGGVRRKPTDTFDRGTLIHKLVLGEGATVRIIRADSFRTKAAREERDEAREAGELPVLEEAYEGARDAAEAIYTNIAAQGVELRGESEVSVTWQSETSRGSIWARARLDHLALDGGVIYDLKSTRSAQPDDCARSTINYGYDIQRAAYVEGLEAAAPLLAGAIDYVLLFAEYEPPYAVTVARLDGALREHGERRWRRAKETWARCTRDACWPSYALGPVFLEAPQWLLARTEEG